MAIVFPPDVFFFPTLLAVTFVVAISSLASGWAVVAFAILPRGSGVNGPGLCSPLMVDAVSTHFGDSLLWDFSSNSEEVIVPYNQGYGCVRV